jgi:excisionase family DNA binding protein
MIIENPFEILYKKLESMEMQMSKMHDKLNKIEGSGLNTDKPATRKEAAEYLGVSLRTVDALLKSGQLTPVRIGSSVRFTYKDLDTFIEKKKTIKP